MTRHQPRVLIPALNLTGEENHPDLSMFETTLKGRVRCTVCGRSGEPEQVWVFICLAGHPARCTVEGCNRAFTSVSLLATHTAGKHAELFAWRTGETKRARDARVSQERRTRLREAGISRRAA